MTGAATPVGFLLPPVGPWPVLDYFPSPLTFDKLQWAVFGVHLLIVAVFIAGAVRYLQGGQPTGAALQLMLAILFTGLGLVVARIVDRV